MRLGLSERLTVTLRKEEKDKIEQAALLNGETMCLYARNVLLKNAENVIKKNSQKQKN